MSAFYEESVAEHYSASEVSALDVFPWSRRWLVGIQSVLDVGCGQGQALEFLRAENPLLEVEGVDPSPAMIARARHPEWITCTTAEAMELTRRTFDLAISRFSFKWFSNRAVAVRNINRHLALGGTVLIWETGEEDFGAAIRVVTRSLAMTGAGAARVRDYFARHRVSVAVARRTLERSGFLIEEVCERRTAAHFHSAEAFSRVWLQGFGIAQELARLLEIRPREVLDAAEAGLERRFGRELTLWHHEWGLVGRKERQWHTE